jgi:hypothetical protein
MLLKEIEKSNFQKFIKFHKNLNLNHTSQNKTSKGDKLPKSRNLIKIENYEGATSKVKFPKGERSF